MENSDKVSSLCFPVENLTALLPTPFQQSFHEACHICQIFQQTLFDKARVSVHVIVKFCRLLGIVAHRDNFLASRDECPGS